MNRDYMQDWIDTEKVCTVTHPKTPNFSGNARGRKSHLTDDGKISLCNMTVDIMHPSSKGLFWSYIGQGMCKTCANIYNEREA